MENKELSVRSVLTISLLSGAAGFINGVWVVFAGTSYFYQFSPYSWMLGVMFLVAPGHVVDNAEDFLFRSGLQLIFAPFLGMFLGAVIGFAASRFSEKPAASFLVKTGAISGGVGGFISLRIIFLNIYAS